MIDDKSEDGGSAKDGVDKSTMWKAIGLYLEDARIHNPEEHKQLIHAMMSNLTPENLGAIIRGIPEERLAALFETYPELEARFAAILDSIEKAADPPT